MASAAAPPIPRIELANAPTPLLKLERLSEEPGLELWVKRDDLTGIPIAWPAERVRDHVTDVVGQARRRYGLPVEAPGDVRVIDGCQEEDRPAALETLLHVARQEGAFCGLLDALRRSPGGLGRRVCFVHTGGIFGLFPFHAELCRLLDQASLVDS